MSDGRPEASDGVWQSDDVHRRPQGVDDDTVTAVGKVSEAMEWLERARGSLYEFHQLLGHLDLQMGEGARLLSEAGHDELAALVDREAVGRNVLDGRWTFQIIEEFDDLYYRPLCAIEKGSATSSWPDGVTCLRLS